jgi:hypothetical protein
VNHRWLTASIYPLPLAHATRPAGQDHRRFSVSRSLSTLGNPQACRITDGEDHAVLQMVHSGEEARHLLLAHDHGQLLRLLASRDVLLDSPGTLEGDSVKNRKVETVT